MDTYSNPVTNTVLPVPERVNRLLDTPIVKLVVVGKSELSDDGSQRTWEVFSARSKQYMFNASIYKIPPDDISGDCNPLVIKMLPNNRKIAAEVHSPANNIIALISQPRGGKVKILNTNEERLQDVVESDYNPFLACILGRVSDHHSVHPKKKQENIGAIQHANPKEGTQVTMSAALDVTARAALLGVTMLLYNNVELE